jgi:hypothetical protein
VDTMQQQKCEGEGGKEDRTCYCDVFAFVLEECVPICPEILENANMDSVRKFSSNSSDATDITDGSEETDISDASKAAANSNEKGGDSRVLASVLIMAVAFLLL